jgi:hypothetical protein
MTARDDRKDVRNQHADPVNFKCGGCGKVQPYDPENPLICAECGYGGPTD